MVSGARYEIWLPWLIEEAGTLPATDLVYRKDWGEEEMASCMKISVNSSGLVKNVGIA